MEIIKQLIKKVFYLFGYQVSQVGEDISIKVSLRMLIADLLLKQGNLFFVQVGAYDGKSNDPIYEIVKKHRLNGILIEPQVAIFEKLKENYSNLANLIFLNAAISDKDGFQVLYKVSSHPESPDWADQLASFNKANILKHRHALPQVEELILEEKVETISPTTLVKNYKIQAIDLLIIDTEGYDYDIIKLFDSTGIKPKIIFFKSIHLGDSYQKCIDFLTTRNYKVSLLGNDSLALLDSSNTV